jgi:hypothetical protein
MLIPVVTDIALKLTLFIDYQVPFRVCFVFPTEKIRATGKAMCKSNIAVGRVDAIRIPAYVILFFLTSEFEYYSRFKF